MSIAKQIARKVVFPLVVGTGLEKAFKFFSPAKKQILLYHGVVNSPKHDISVGPISSDSFEKQIKYLRDNFDVVTQEEIFQMYRDDYTPKKHTVAITFDDGYANNYSIAYPIMKKYNVPSTMYILSQCLEDNERLTWSDYIDFVKDKLDLHKISSLNSSINNIPALKDFIKGLTIEQRNKLFTELNKQVNVQSNPLYFEPEHWRLMNTAQIKELAESGLVEIGAHSHNHPNLGRIDINEAKNEMKTSKDLLESVINKKIHSIAFPDGCYTKEVKQAALDLGYKNLLAVDYKLQEDKEDKNILSRYCISSTTTVESNIFNINKSFKQYGF